MGYSSTQVSAQRVCAGCFCHLSAFCSCAFFALRSHIERIGKESANFRAGLHSEYRPSDKDFPRIIYNNRPETKRLKQIM